MAGSDGSASVRLVSSLLLNVDSPGSLRGGARLPPVSTGGKAATPSGIEVRASVGAIGIGEPAGPVSFGSSVIAVNVLLEEGGVVL